MSLWIIAACGGADDEPSNVRQEGSTTTTPAADVGPAVARAATSTPQGVFVYSVGGDTPAGAVALVDPATGEQTPLADPPIDDPLDVPALATVGDEVLLVGRTCAELVPIEGDDDLECSPGRLTAAIFSLDEGSWRQAEVPDELSTLASPIVRVVGAVDGGPVAFEIRPEGLTEVGDAPLWTFSVAEDEWRRLSDPGIPVGDACVSGSEIAVVSSTNDGGDVVGVTLATTSLTSDGSWVRGEPAADFALQDDPDLACTDEVAVAYGAEAYDPNGPVVMPTVAIAAAVTGDGPAPWTALPPVPEAVPAPLTALWTGEQLLLLAPETGTAAVLAVDLTSWRTIEAPRSRFYELPAIWDGDRIVVIDPDADTGVQTAPVPR